MSRTHKDKPAKIQFPESYDLWFDCEKIEYFNGVYNSVWYKQIPGVKTKKKRSHEEWNWMTTPMWWIREFMNQPQRARGHQWERKAKKVNIEDLDDLDYPDVSRKPHIYYW